MRSALGAAPIGLLAVVAATATAAIGTIAAPRCAAGLPLLSGARTVGGFTVYPDDGDARVRYVGPGELSLSVDSDGQPEVRLLLARHTGTRVTGDAGQVQFRSVFTVGVRQARPRSADESAIRAQLALAPAIELRPLPVQRLESAVVYAPIAAAAGDAAAPGSAGAERSLVGGHFESSAAGSVVGDGSQAVWSERVFTIALGSEDAQLLWEALEHGTALSVGYAFVAHVAEESAEPISEVRQGGSLSAGLAAGLNERLRAVPGLFRGPRAAADGAAAEPPPARLAIVRSGAVGVAVDVARHPAVRKQVDLDAGLPPGYAALDVYCTDFRDEVAPEVDEKQVEIEAQSVTDKATTLSLVFRSTAPEDYARTARFPVAVRLDRPFRYRVITVTRSGEEQLGDWRVGAWARMLDVSAAFLDRGAPPAPPPSPPSSPFGGSHAQVEIVD